MVNHNKLIGRVIGVDGLKTGYTENAGYCLSTTAERNGRRIVAVIMGCFGPNGEIDKGVARDRKMIELLERGFAGLPAGAAPATTVPTAPTPKPAATPKATANKPTQTAPTAAPAIQATPTPQPVSPVSSAESEVSPVQAASNPVSSAAESTDAAAPSVKFELPKKTPATKK